ncbi:zinc finger BED domain-containing protein DAYSLEEPER-like [Zingiber officinale]|uniref:zinc finger BED domain-containing protein DAYSLEEPER-like n=1 Tax=Zingiber officinale TaxID=94328 RepID=UPI001C4D9769|nr:zinc finger BED domain-containing protein DAYSLEEPER-like [Zingiber officinale]
MSIKRFQLTIIFKDKFLIAETLRRHSTFRRRPFAHPSSPTSLPSPTSSLHRRHPFADAVPSKTPSLRINLHRRPSPPLTPLPSTFNASGLSSPVIVDRSLPPVQMEINDNEVEGVMLTTPTVGSEVHAATESHSQNESVPIEANEATLNNTLDVEISGTNGEKKRKIRSIAWDHFEKKLIEGKWKAVCNDCKKSLGGETKNGTKHLLNHMKTCLHKKQKTIQQSLLQPTKSNDGTTQLGTYHFNQDQARAELANIIILHEYPLSMVDHVGFRR